MRRGLLPGFLGRAGPRSYRPLVFWDGVAQHLAGIQQQPASRGFENIAFKPGVWSPTVHASFQPALLRRAAQYVWFRWPPGRGPSAAICRGWNPP